MSIETGGPAFPAESEAQTGPSTFRYEGMTLRDYMAAAAMNALANEYFQMLKDETWTGEFRKEVREAVPICAELSYYIADAMLAARDMGREG